ncbi:MAG: hypothetical protein MRECE_10c041 [Mycoplasmataceae bacterium CE_OT135]|nr:MAG: hypothetical protein MRECE_10c041 [Mycoplasmataceae bacterium CE_OT135]
MAKISISSKDNNLNFKNASPKNSVLFGFLGVFSPPPLNNKPKNPRTLKTDLTIL